MTISANITPSALSDGIVYCTSVPLTSSEADLGDSLKTPSPVGVAEGQVMVAVVKLAITGYITAPSTYVIMQTDLGDGTWIDVAWLFTTINQGTATFVLIGGGGITSNAFQQSRQSGSAPATQASGYNQVPLGGRVRFVGKVLMTGGSSSISGTPTAVAATITYKLMYPR